MNEQNERTADGGSDARNAGLEVRRCKDCGRVLVTVDEKGLGVCEPCDMRGGPPEDSERKPTATFWDGCCSVWTPGMQSNGIELRDLFAAAALAGTSDRHDWTEREFEHRAKDAYKIADAMLKARKR